MTYDDKTGSYAVRGVEVSGIDPACTMVGIQVADADGRQVQSVTADATESGLVVVLPTPVPVEQVGAITVIGEQMRTASWMWGPDGLAVMAQVSGDRRDRPTPGVERVSVHIVLPCDHGDGAPSSGGGGQRPPASREPHPNWWSPTGGELQ